jgi:hypothetical protein
VFGGAEKGFVSAFQSRYSAVTMKITQNVRLHWLNTRTALVAGLFFVLGIGCVSNRTPPETPASAAKRYAVEKFGFSRPKVERVISLPTGYEVLVWDLPYRPGENWIMTLSKDLRLVAWQGGR